MLINLLSWFLQFLRLVKALGLLFCVFGPLIFPAAGISIEPLPFFPLDLSPNSLWLWSCVLFGALPYGGGVLLLKYSRGRGLRLLGHLLTVFPLVMAGLVFRNYWWGGSLLLATPFFLLTRKCTPQEVLSWLEELLLNSNLPLDLESRDRWVKEVLESGGGGDEAAIRQELLKRLEEEVARRADALRPTPSPSSTSTLYQDLCEVAATHPVATALLVVTAVATVVFFVWMWQGSGPNDAGGAVAGQAGASAPLPPAPAGGDAGGTVGGAFGGQARASAPLPRVRFDAAAMARLKASWEAHIRSQVYKDPKEFARLFAEFEAQFNLQLDEVDVGAQERAQVRWEVYVQAREAARQRWTPEARALYNAELRNQQELLTILRMNPQGLSQEEILSRAYEQLQRTLDANPAPEAVRLLALTEHLGFIPEMVAGLRDIGNPAATAQADYLEAMLPGLPAAFF